MATTTLHFHLIISLLFFLFFSSSHIIIISCFAIAVTTTHEGQGQEQIQVPSSVTPKAAAVHYWHLKTHSNKPLSPIFLSKLSPLSPSKFITKNDETMRAMSNGDNKVKMGKIDAPQDRHPTASDVGEFPFFYHKYAQDGDTQDRHPATSDEGENPLFYHKYAQDRHPTASDEGENPLFYHKYAQDRHPTASDEGENPLFYHKYAHDRHPTAIDEGENPLFYHKYAHDRHPTSTDEGENPLFYHKYAHDRHPTASNEGFLASDEGENPLFYHKYAHDRHPTTSDEGENPLFYHKYAHDRYPTASDEGENPLFYHKYAHDRHPTTSDEGENPLFYHKYAQDRHPTASDEGENPLFYHKYNTPDHHDTVDDDAKSATNHYNVDPSNNIKMVTGDEIKEKVAKQISPGPRGIFFRESELKEGKTIPLLKFAGSGSGQYFLPRSIASRIPFFATAISKIFHIPTDSALYRAMKSTIGHCRMPPNTGETKKCITSAEDMIDYALSTLGADADIQFWSTHNSSRFGGKSLIGKVKVVYDGELTAKQHLTCHKVTFPYLLYHCHSVSNTRVYDIEILDAETKENINRGAAVCHLDTTGWDPDHKSFVALASAPGMTEVCHWIPPWDMALTTRDGAAVTATATATATIAE